MEKAYKNEEYMKEVVLKPKNNLDGFFVHECC